MRAMIAKRAHGHPFEERFTKLNPIQLIVAYRQAVKDEQREVEDKVDLFVKLITFLKGQFELNNMFTNDKMFSLMKEFEQIKEHRDDINEDNFSEVWAEAMEMFPSEFEVSDIEADVSQFIPEFTPEMEQHIAGIVPRSSIKESEPNGNE